MADPAPNDKPSLDTLAEEIRAGFEEADRLRYEGEDHRLETGWKLIQAQKLVKAAGLAWEKWVLETLDRSLSDVRLCMSFFRHPKDPKKHLTLEQARRRLADYRAKHAREEAKRREEEKKRLLKEGIRGRKEAPARASGSRSDAAQSAPPPLTVEAIEAAVMALSVDDLQRFCEWPTNSKRRGSGSRTAGRRWRRQRRRANQSSHHSPLHHNQPPNRARYHECERSTCEARSAAPEACPAPCP
jgi:hypothetical protein